MSTIAAIASQGIGGAEGASASAGDGKSSVDSLNGLFDKVVSDVANAKNDSQGGNTAESPYVDNAGDGSDGISNLPDPDDGGSDGISDLPDPDDGGPDGITDLPDPDDGGPDGITDLPDPDDDRSDGISDLPYDDGVDDRTTS